MLSRVRIDPNAARSSVTVSEAKRLRCSVVRGRTNLTLEPRLNGDWQLEVQCEVEGKSYGHNLVGQIHRAPEGLRVPAHREADPMWNHRRPIHIILGADVACRLLLGPAVGRPGKLLAQNTKFGKFEDLDP